MVLNDFLSSLLEWQRFKKLWLGSPGVCQPYDGFKWDLFASKHTRSLSGKSHITLDPLSFLSLCHPKHHSFMLWELRPQRWRLPGLQSSFPCERNNTHSFGSLCLPSNTARGSHLTRVARVVCLNANPIMSSCFQNSDGISLPAPLLAIIGCRLKAALAPPKKLENESNCFQVA